MYGFCHDGCGGRPKISPHNHTAQRQTKGQPNCFLKGHNRHRVIGAWAKNGVPIDKVRPVAKWLIQIYGTAELEALTGISRGTIQSIAYTTGRKRCHPDFARRLHELVKISQRSRDPWRWSEGENPPRLALGRERTVIKRFRPGRSGAPLAKTVEVVDALMKRFGGVEQVAREWAMLTGRDHTSCARSLTRVRAGRAVSYGRLAELTEVLNYHAGVAA